MLVHLCMYLFMYSLSAPPPPQKKTQYQLFQLFVRVLHYLIITTRHLSDRGLCHVLYHLYLH